MICILDYGSGNVGSVYNVIKFLGYEVIISNKSEDIINSSHLILPGVGAFPSSMEKILSSLPIDTLEDEVLKKGKPFLGICVGMQVLATKGFEKNECKGLGWIEGTVERIESDKLALPHIGWNDIEFIQDNSLSDSFKDINDFYFVHSYCFKEKNHKNSIAKVTYGSKFNAIVQKDNIFGFQFHPEKSQRAGQLILKNFFKMS
mgnify:FL=1|tara:strand:- start:26320 stop:26928 length:609 start_codon:yes stop_codon:yes gene_type:complete